MVLLLINLFLADPTSPVNYVISEITAKVNGFGNSPIVRPKAIAKHGKWLAVYDKESRVWVLSSRGEVYSVFGRKGQGPGEFAQFQQLYLGDDTVEVLHRRGSYGRLEKFTYEGIYVNGERTGTSVYSRDHGTIAFRRVDRNVFSPIEVVWKINNKKEIFTLGDSEDRAFSSRYRIISRGDFSLVYSGHSVKRTIYFLLLNWQKETIWDKAQIRLLDKRVSLTEERFLQAMKPNASLPVVEGCTSSEELGFVINEHVRSQDYRILRILEPKTRTWRAIKVHFGPELNNLFFFQHIQGTRWMAFSDSDELVFFHLREAS